MVGPTSHALNSVRVGVTTFCRWQNVFSFSSRRGRGLGRGGTYRVGLLIAAMLMADAIGHLTPALSPRAGEGEEARAGAPSNSEITTDPWLHPYTGPTRSDIDATTLDGKVLCGYQGWFNTPGDGTGFGFTHWGQGLERRGGRFTIDLWPDVSEYDPHDLREVPGVKMPD